jgi:hypothetical protein
MAGEFTVTHTENGDTVCIEPPVLLLAMAGAMDDIVQQCGKVRTALNYFVVYPDRAR